MEHKDVRDFLLHGTEAGDLIKFTSGGWQTGITQIDDEDLFVHGVPEDILNHKHFTVSKDFIYLKGGVQIGATRIELDSGD